MQLSESDTKRFWSRVDRRGDDECWPWLAGHIPQGYGTMKLDGRPHGAHRISACIHHGLDLDNSSVLVCHKCDNPNCVNPSHLFLGTHRDNIRDAYKKNRMVDNRGHRHGMAKLDEPGVLAIREMLAAGLPQTAIASHFGIGQMTVSNIATRTTWRHLP